MDVCFLDVQGLRGKDGEFVWKEVGILKSPFECTFDYLVKPPYGLHLLSEKYRRVNYWLRANKHGLSWENGWVPYEKLGDLLYSVLVNENVYVKGTEKTKWLEKCIGEKRMSTLTVDNIEEFGCPKLESVKLSVEKKKCREHSESKNVNKACAIENVWKMYHFYCNREK